MLTISYYIHVTFIWLHALIIWVFLCEVKSVIIYVCLEKELWIIFVNGLRDNSEATLIPRLYILFNYPYIRFNFRCVNLFLDCYEWFDGGGVALIPVQFSLLPI